MKANYTKKRGSVLLIAIMTITITGVIIASLSKYTNQSSIITERQYGSIQASLLSESALIIRSKVLEEVANNSVSDSDIKIFEENISKLFSQVSSKNINVNLSFNELQRTLNSTMTPGSGIDLPGFDGIQSTEAVIRLGDSSGSIRTGIIGKTASSENIRLIPAFSMLSFYQEDLEIQEPWEDCRFFGRIHCNANVYLSSRRHDWDPTVFYTKQNSPAISCAGKLYRRSRSGQTPDFTSDHTSYGHTQHCDDDAKFLIYTESDFENLFANNGLFTDSGSPSEIQLQYTDLEGNINLSSYNDIDFQNRLRFADPDSMYLMKEKSADVQVGTITNEFNNLVECDNASSFTDSDNYLSPPASIKPYQYIEDIQFYDKWDTNLQVSWQLDRPISNFSKDTKGKLKEEALCSRAALVIRDGVAYYRTTPGGSLNLVSPVGINAHEPSLGYYPSKTHPKANKYSDLRWFGWFGMNDGIEPTPDNPARWHFPIKSVSFMKSSSYDGAPNKQTPARSFEFTYDSSSPHNPVTDASSLSLPQHFIDSNHDTHDIYSNISPSSSTPFLNHWRGNSAPSPIADIYWPAESFHPKANSLGQRNTDILRAQYVALKKRIRTLYNANHIYTSLHNGNTILNLSGNTPTGNTPPDCWGDITSSKTPFKADYGYSAFWDDDGDVTTPKVELFPNGDPTVFNGWHTATSFSDSDMNETTEYIYANNGNSHFVSYKAWANGTGIEIEYSTNNSSNTHEIELKIEKISGTDQIIKQALPGANKTKKIFKFTKNNLVIDRNDKIIINIPNGNNGLKIFNIKIVNAICNFAIYKSTLPLSNRTISMPTSKTPLSGPQSFMQTNKDCDLNWSIDYLENWKFNDDDLDPHNDFNNTPTSTEYPISWYWRLNNWPESLRRITSSSNWNNNTPYHLDKFLYYAGDSGGYYGNDNLCIFNEREKKFQVFTEIDLSEFTKECLEYNGISDIIKSDSTTPSYLNGKPSDLENIIYIINSSVGNNFYGNLNNNGAVRLKRGETFWTRLTVATPNPIYIWGDLNSPNFSHRVSVGSAAFSYTVPSKFHNQSIKSYPMAIYADSINALPNNWFKGDGKLQNTLHKSGLSSALSFSKVNSANIQISSNFVFDSTFWWEDDGQRIAGNVHKDTSLPFSDFNNYGSLEDYINYTWLIFDEPTNALNVKTVLPFLGNSTGLGHRREQTPLSYWGPMSINSALFYGQVLSTPPVLFDYSQRIALPTKPYSSISDFEWYLENISTDERIIFPNLSDNLATIYNNSGNNGTFTYTHADTTVEEIGFINEKTYFGTKFNSVNDDPGDIFERFKGYFGGGGLNNAIRLHQYYYHDLSNHNSLGLYLTGSLVSLFQSRQDTNFYCSYLLSAQAHQLYFRYNKDYDNAAQLPPGTPLMTQVSGTSFFQKQGSKYR